MRMLKEKYKEEGVNIDDPEEQPFHEDLSNLKVIMAGIVKRTREAQEQGDSVMPLTFLWIDDLMTGSGVAGYRYNADIDKLFFHFKARRRCGLPFDTVLSHVVKNCKVAGHPPGRVGSAAGHVG